MNLQSVQSTRLSLNGKSFLILFSQNTISEETPVNGLLQTPLPGRKRCPSANNVFSANFSSNSPSHASDESSDGSIDTPRVQGSKGGMYITYCLFDL